VNCSQCGKPLPDDPPRVVVEELNNGATGRKWQHDEFFCNNECEVSYVARRTEERGYPTKVIEAS
jgi:hypothetical protein